MTAAAAPRALPPRLAAPLVFLTSGAVLVLEIVGLRLVAPYVGVTLQTTSGVIGVALGAIAYGAWSGGWLADRVDPRRLVGPALVLGGAATVLVLPVVRWAGAWLRGAAAPGVVLLAALVLFVPGALLSAVTPMVVKLQLADLGRTGTVVGRLSATGTLGAITATFATGFVLVAAFPSTGIVLGLAALVAGVGLVLTAYLGRLSHRFALAAALTGLGGTALTAAAPDPCDVETAYHCARVTVDAAHPSGRTLWLNAARHSYVDIADPTHLEYAYTKVIGALVDAAAPPGAPLATLHLGAGGLTLPGYLAATRPGSRSRVVEVDGALLRLDRDRLPVPSTMEEWVGDARVGIGREPGGRWQLVIGDAFGYFTVPWHLTTREMAGEVRRVLRPDGIYAMNVIDMPHGRFARAEAATLAGVYAHTAVAVVAAAPGTRTNLVLLASAAPLPLAALRDRLGGVSIVDGRTFAAGAGPLTDDYAPVDQMLLG